MSLKYSFNDAKDLFFKLQRDIKKLENEVNGDNFFNMIITAYHIRDWIKNNRSYNSVIHNDVDSVFTNKYFLMCRDITNASKHFELNYPPQTNNIDSLKGYGRGRYGKGKFGSGEESIIIKYSDGTEINALDLAKELLSLWDSFFANHNI